MMRRFFLAAVFGTLVSLVAIHAGATAQSPIQAILVGVLSAFGFLTASMFMRGRVRRKQGEIPSMLAGEEARLYGPGELSDSTGSAKVWIYVSNMRLMLRDEDGDKLDLPLSEIEELRPPRSGLFSGEVSLVAKGRGLLRLKVPDALRWHSAIRSAIHRD
jgi:hypothetical protein